MLSHAEEFSFWKPSRPALQIEGICSHSLCIQERDMQLCLPAQVTQPGRCDAREAEKAVHTRLVPQLPTRFDCQNVTVESC